MKEIILSDGSVCLVDDADYDWLSRWRWKPHNNGYASRSIKRNKKSALLLMHRFILGEPEGLHVHHINGIKLDNRRENLEAVDPREHRIHHVDHLVRYAKEHSKHPEFKNCATCNAVFKCNPKKRGRHKCCSEKCARTITVRAAIEARREKARNRGAASPSLETQS